MTAYNSREYIKTNFVGAYLGKQHLNYEIEYAKIYNVLLQASWSLMSVDRIEEEQLER